MIRVSDYLSQSVIDIRVKVSKLFVLLILLLPAIAYGDTIFFGDLGFWHYFKASFLEIFLVFLGFSMAKNEEKL